MQVLPVSAARLGRLISIAKLLCTDVAQARCSAVLMFAELLNMTALNAAEAPARRLFLQSTTDSTTTSRDHLHQLHRT